MAYEDVLAATELFQGVSHDELTDLAAHATNRRLVRGDVLFKEGDPADSLFVALRGRIAIANKSFDGRESVARAHGAR